MDLHKVLHRDSNHNSIEMINVPNRDIDQLKWMLLQPYSPMRGSSQITTQGDFKASQNYI